MRTVLFLDPAEEEMVQAAKYYEMQAPRLGVDFLIEVERTADKFVEFPYAATKIRARFGVNCFADFLTQSCIE